MSDNTQLLKLLEELKEVPDRDPAVVRHNRAAFLQEAAQSARQPVSISPLQRLINSLNIRQYRLQFSTLTIGIILGITLLTFSSGVYAARRSTPNQFLYPVKLWLEDSRLTFTRQSDALLDLRLEYAEERLSEIEGFSGDISDPALSATLQNLDEQYTAIQALTSSDNLNQDQQHRLEKIQEQLQSIHPEDEDDDDDSHGTSDDKGKPDSGIYTGDDQEKEDNASETESGDEAEIESEDHEPGATETGEDGSEDSEDGENSKPEETPEPEDDSSQENEEGSDSESESNSNTEEESDSGDNDNEV